MKKLLPYKYQGINTIYILFDGDKAGRDAATGLNKYASEVFNIKILDLEDGKDPGSLTQKEVNEIKEKII